MHSAISTPRISHTLVSLNCFFCCRFVLMSLAPNLHKVSQSFSIRLCYPLQQEAQNDRLHCVNANILRHVHEVQQHFSQVHVRYTCSTDAKFVTPCNYCNKLSTSLFHSTAMLWPSVLFYIYINVLQLKYACANIIYNTCLLVHACIQSVNND